MKKGWKTKKLEEVCDVEYGTRVVRKRDGGEKYPVYGGGGATFFMDAFNRENCLIIARFAMSEKCTRFVDGKFFLNDSGLTVKPKDKKNISQPFLDWQFIYLNDHIYSLARGAAQKNLDMPAFRNIEISCPNSLSEQKRIVSILDKAFADIAKAKENTEKNLQNAKEIFESYLHGVFENGNWETYRFADLCNLVTCGVAATPKYVDESVGVPFLSAQNVKNGKVVLDKHKFISKEFHKELTKKNKPQKGDILYSRVGAKYGEAGVVEHDFEFSVYVSLTLIKTKPEKLDNYFLKYLLNSRAVKELAKKSIGSSGVPNLNVKDVREFKIICPPLNEQKKLVNDIEKMRSETQKLEVIYQNKISNFEELKKSILQKAFNGDL